jgi:hypothetical protein
VAINTDRNGAADNRLGQLSAALHRDDFGFETILFKYAALVRRPNRSKFSAQTRDADPESFSPSGTWICPTKRDAARE